MNTQETLKGQSFKTLLASSNRNKMYLITTFSAKKSKTSFEVHFVSTPEKYEGTKRIAPVIDTKEITSYAEAAEFFDSVILSQSE